jgi:sulfite reductase beta subunit-like hemoprotein
MRYAAECVKPYGADGCLDITTRANLQLRGVKLEDAGEAACLRRGAARRGGGGAVRCGCVCARVCVS